MSRRAIAPVTLAALAALHVTPFAPAPSLTVLSANVGNLDMLADGPCAAWPARGALCVSDDERAVSASIHAYAPDVVALFEVISPDRCDPTDDPARVCGPHPGEDPASVRRLTGPEYTIVCDGIGGYDCIALRASMLTVEGCAPGARCVAPTPPQPDECAGHADFSSVFAVDSVWNGRPIRWIVAHPYQAISDEEDPCRAAQLRQALIDLPAAGPTALLGDLNIDPDRLWPWFASPDTWFAAVGYGKRFHELHDGLGVPAPTWKGLFALDHVAVSHLVGGCMVGDPLADAPDRLDHRPLWCAFTLPR